jgi:hypothetical protein
MDLVEEAGHDISDWAKFKGGVSKAASNPKYCYEWVYCQQKLSVILNLWFSGLQTAEDGIIFQGLNMRSLSSSLSAVKGKRHVSKRAYKFDEALKLAYRENLPVRVVVCEGSESDVLNPDTPASQVERRKLDPKHWSVSFYDMITGQCKVERRPRPGNHFVDQHSLPEFRKSQRTDITSSVYNRQRSVRDAALARAKGICEYCGEPGFVTTGDYLYLETHHITPLSEGGHDAIDNVISLCPNDHMLAHFGKERVSVKEKLQNILFEKNSGDA